MVEFGYGFGNTSNEKHDMVAAIDIGTSKVCTIISAIDKDGKMSVLGNGIDYCNGMKKGMIVDIESVTNSIMASIEKAETASNTKVSSAYVNITGAHVDIVANRGVAPVKSETREITVADVQKVLSVAREIELPPDKQVIDINPKQYIVDEYDGIIDPVGMVGFRLEVDADVVLGRTASVRNIMRSMEKANIKVDGIIVEPIATAEVALTAEEKEMGVILVDVGGNITNMSVFENGEMVFCGCVPIGGDNITNDIALGLKVSNSDAEKLKREYELALTSLIKNDYEIVINEVNCNTKKTVRVSQIVEIIEARISEIFSYGKGLLEKSGIMKNYSAGVVLTGGGISYVDGGMQLSNSVFEMSTRVASYKGMGIIKPEYATVTGMIKYIANQRKVYGNIGSNVVLKKAGGFKNGGLILQKLKKMVSDFF